VLGFFFCKICQSADIGIYCTTWPSMHFLFSIVKTLKCRRNLCDMCMRRDQIMVMEGNSKQEIIGMSLLQFVKNYIWMCSIDIFLCLNACVLVHFIVV